MDIEDDPDDDDEDEIDDRIKPKLPKVSSG